MNYNDPMNAQGKEGVGLVLDLGADRTISEVELSLLTAGGALELRAAPAGLDRGARTRSRTGPS